MKAIYLVLISCLIFTQVTNVTWAQQQNSKDTNALTSEAFSTIMNSNAGKQIGDALEKINNGNISGETDLNRKLLENSKKAQEIKDKANPKVEHKIRSYGNQNITGNDDPDNLTDQDRELSQNYIHQGLANQIIAEKCTGEMEGACAGEAPKTKFMGMDKNMIEMAAKMYAVFSTMSGGMKISKPLPKEGSLEAGEATNNETTKKSEKEEATDYCKYIPAATEGLAAFQQTASQNDIQKQVIATEETAQKSALMAAAKSHDQRAKQAQIQAGGWYGGAACYVGMAATGKMDFKDKNFIIKTGASLFLGTFYQNEVKANKDYAKKTRDIANSLPGKGDCNPITDKLCYCSQPTTENDPQHCSTQVHSKKMAQDSYRVACTDENLKIDPMCNCEKTNSCFDSAFDAATNGIFNLGMANSENAYDGLRSLSRGELQGTTMSNKSFAKLAAIAKDGLRKAASDIEAPSLNKAQMNESKLLEEQGLPRSIAQSLASQTPSESALQAARGALGGTSGQVAAIPSKNTNIIQFSGGHGLGTKGSKSKSDDGDDDLLKKLTAGQNKGKAPANANVIKFAEKAENSARNSNQIRKHDTPIFDIISMRYQLSGRRLLEIKDE